MEPITNFIPQRPPMVMIDELVRGESDSAVSSFLIMPDNIFVEDGKFTEPGLIENIAQTAAAMVGHHCVQHKLPVPIGFIAAVKDLKIDFIPPVGSLILTKVKVTNTVMDVTIIGGKVELAEEVICSCEMKILIKK
jgi:predicted hotdog family 3-hydroxylacyl-ACP dehydratase